MEKYLQRCEENDEALQNMTETLRVKMIVDGANSLVELLSVGFEEYKQYKEEIYFDMLYFYMLMMSSPINKNKKKLLSNFEKMMVEQIEKYCIARDIECGIE